MPDIENTEGYSFYAEKELALSQTKSLKRIADAMEQSNFIQSEILEQLKWMPKT